MRIWLGAEREAAPSIPVLERTRELALRFWPFAVGLGVLVAVLFVRFYRLDEVPANLTADETDFFQEVYRILEGHRPSWFHQGQPASLLPLGAYPMALSVRIFGDSLFGLRMYSVLLSLATLVVFFVLVRHRFSPLVALVATLLLATNIWFLHFSRTAWSNMNAALIVIGITSTLLLGLERGRWWWFVGAGLFIGAAPWAYVSARILPIVPMVFFPVALFIYRAHWRRVVSGFALAGVVALVIAAPVLNEMRHGLWGPYTGRARQVSIFNGRSHADAWAQVPDNLRRTLQGFTLLSNADRVFETHDIFRGSTEGRRYAPAGGELFDPLTRVLFYVGLLVGVWKWRQTALWWLMLLAPLPIQVFATGTPDGARGLMLVPIIFLFVALALETLSSFGRRRLPDQRWAVGVGAAAVLVGGVLAVVNVRSYFDWMESDYALADRQPGVWAYEFEEWSSFQRKAGEQGAIGFNAGTWRERQDRAGCLTGRVDGNLCADLPVDASPDPLGRTLVQPAEVPVELTQRTLAEIDAEEFRLLHGGYSDLLMQTLQTIQIEEAWVTTFAAEGVGVTASVARLASEDQANLAFLRKSTLTGQDYLGGPEAEQLPAPPLGDVALLVHFRLSDREWWEYFWKDGTYVANVQALYLPASPDAQPLPMLEAAARAQAGRLAALVGAR